MGKWEFDREDIKTLRDWVSGEGVPDTAERRALADAKARIDSEFKARREAEAAREKEEENVNPNHNESAEQVRLGLKTAAQHYADMRVDPAQIEEDEHLRKMAEKLRAMLAAPDRIA
jgi:hypothetical protein